MIQDILLKWEGTPYLSGQRIPGRGVDCVGFLCGVLDELFGLDPDKLPPSELGLSETLRLAKRYPHQKLKWPYHGAQMGDVFLCGREGIGHCYIAFSDKILFHADGAQVSRTGISSLAKWEKLVMLRPNRGA